MTFIVILLMTAVIFSVTAHADMFAKPEARIEVVGIDQTFYFEILIFKNGPVSAVDIDSGRDWLSEYYQDDFPLDVLNGYQDDDGFVSRTLYSNKPANLFYEDDVFLVGYFSAPKKFKIAIIFEDGTMITSKVIDRKMFYSKMTYDLTGVNFNLTQTGVGTIKEHVPIGSMSWKFAVRVIITISVELLILWFFKYRLRRSFALVGAINFFTQSLLTMFMILGFYFWGDSFGLVFVVLLGEILVLLTEVLAYHFFLSEQTPRKARQYALVANLATFILAIFTLWFI